jgi:hypothetical protein
VLELPCSASWPASRKSKSVLDFACVVALVLAESRGQVDGTKVFGQLICDGNEVKARCCCCNAVSHCNIARIVEAMKVMKLMGRQPVRV